MDIAVVSLAAGDSYGKTVELAIQSKAEYCRLRGYDFKLGKSADSSRPPAWSKIPLIQSTLPDYDAVFWMDADTLIANYEIWLEQFFSDFINSDKMMIVTTDAKNRPNTGSFLLKNGAWSHELLRRIWEQDQFINHGWWENKAFMHLVETDPRIKENVQLIPNRQLPFNSYPHHGDYREGDFVVHFAGVHDSGVLEQLIKKHYRSPMTRINLVG